jgi:hypothetical protein
MDIATANAKISKEGINLWNPAIKIQKKMRSTMLR